MRHPTGYRGAAGASAVHAADRGAGRGGERSRVGFALVHVLDREAVSLVDRQADGCPRLVRLQTKRGEPGEDLLEFLSGLAAPQDTVQIAFAGLHVTALD